MNKSMEQDCAGVFEQVLNLALRYATLVVGTGSTYGKILILLSMLVLFLVFKKSPVVPMACANIAAKSFGLAFKIMLCGQCLVSVSR
jgi:hypothetical protein